MVTQRHGNFMARYMSVSYCNNNRVSSIDFNIYGEYNPLDVKGYFKGIPIVGTLKEAMSIGIAFVGYDSGDYKYTDNILGLYKDGIFVLWWAVKDYLSAPNWWTDTYTLSTPEELDRVQRLSVLLCKEYKTDSPWRPGFNNWGELAFALRHGIYWADYDGFNERYTITPPVLEVVHDVTLHYNKWRHYIECYSIYHNVDEEISWRCIQDIVYKNLLEKLI